MKVVGPSDDSGTALYLAHDSSGLAHKAIPSTVHTAVNPKVDPTSTSLTAADIARAELQVT